MIERLGFFGRLALGFLTGFLLAGRGWAVLASGGMGRVYPAFGKYR
jgi:hypothetical protein